MKLVVALAVAAAPVSALHGTRAAFIAIEAAARARFGSRDRERIPLRPRSRAASPRVGAERTTAVSRRAARG